MSLIKQIFGSVDPEKYDRAAANVASAVKTGASLALQVCLIGGHVVADAAKLANSAIRKNIKEAHDEPTK